ncbi:MAG: M15 family metallopeptidase [Akkermansia sp.]|nr:M15 family metallopeptidase [Akkermansia sp.]
MKYLSLFSCVAAVLLTQCSTTEITAAPAKSAVSYAVEEGALPADFCYLDELPNVKVDLKYSTCDNFVGCPIDGYEGTRAILRKDTARAVKKVAAKLAKEGLGLVIWDAYRPARAMAHFRRWSRRPEDGSTKPTFYPNITKQGIYDGRYIGKVSEHSWGIAVDVTLYDIDTGMELDMGGRHDFLDVSSSTESTLVTPQQRANRLKLREVMAAAGMRNYRKEWWHYFLTNASPVVRHDFVVRDDLKATQRKIVKKSKKK